MTGIKESVPSARPRTACRFSVFGNANLEVHVGIGKFPVEYEPDRAEPHEISVSVSGTAYNVGTALWKLGNTVTLCVTQGTDHIGSFVAQSQPADPQLRIVPLPVAAQAITAVLAADNGERLVLLDPCGTRGARHDPQANRAVIDGSDILVLPVGGVNTALAEHLAAERADSPHAAHPKGPLVVCDVHAIVGLTGPHEPFCRAADVLFMSDERLQQPAEVWLEHVMDRWPCRIAIVTQGARGATIAIRGDEQTFHQIPAAPPPPIASTIGAGDALCAAFLDGYAQDLPPVAALRRATFFAAAKLGGVGGAEGFLTRTELDRIAGVNSFDA